MPDAKSSAGAYGLMQLMPATAKLMARRTGEPFKYNRQLTDPSLNIKLGSEYLGRMLRRYENNRIFASAAYNAGPSNVDRWINPELPLDVWIETIPFTETRNYVKNVLMFSTIYGRLLKQNQPLIYNHEFEDFSSSIVIGPSLDSPNIDNPAIDSQSIGGPSIGGPSIGNPSIGSPSIDSPSIDGPSIDGPSIDGPIIDGPAINPQEIDALAPAIQGGIGNTNASE
jgi:hypothetical protein